jgi:hypothetical protein
VNLQRPRGGRWLARSGLRVGDGSHDRDFGRALSQCDLLTRELCKREPPFRTPNGRATRRQERIAGPAAVGTGRRCNRSLGADRAGSWNCYRNGIVTISQPPTWASGARSGRVGVDATRGDLRHSATIPQGQTRLRRKAIGHLVESRGCHPRARSSLRTPNELMDP